MPAISSRKLAANRANAHNSTGARTAGGKARSSRNACTHGLNSRDFVVRSGEQPEFDEFLSRYRCELDPSGALEETLFSELVHAAWNLRRVHGLEAELFAATGIDPIADDDSERKLARYARYAQRFERTLHRAIRELRTLQSERAAASSLAALDEQFAPLVSQRAVNLTKRTHHQVTEQFYRSEIARVRFDRDFSTLLIEDREPAQAAPAGLRG